MLVVALLKNGWRRGNDFLKVASNAKKLCLCFILWAKHRYSYFSLRSYDWICLSYTQSLLPTPVGSVFVCLSKCVLVCFGKSTRIRWRFLGTDLICCDSCFVLFPWSLSRSNSITVALYIVTFLFIGFTFHFNLFLHLLLIGHFFAFCNCCWSLLNPLAGSIYITALWESEDLRTWSRYLCLLEFYHVSRFWWFFLFIDPRQSKKLIPATPRSLRSGINALELLKQEYVYFHWIGQFYGH